MADKAALKRRLGHSRLLEGLAAVADRLPWPARRCVVLTFHRIETGDSRLYPGLASVGPDEFRDLVDGVCRSFQPVSIEQVLEAMGGGRGLPERAVLFTFDDAYRDFASVAWPVLRAAGAPVLLFVPTAFPDQPDHIFWWDRLYESLAAADPAAWHELGVDAPDALGAFRQLRGPLKAMPHDDAMSQIDRIVQALGTTLEVRDLVLGWDELQELSRQGVALAPHSRTHPMLDQLNPELLSGEIAGSRDDLGANIDAVTNVFAYPAGGHSATVRAAVAEAGFEAAFTTERGVMDVSRDDRFRLPRLNVGRAATFASLRGEIAVRRQGVAK